MQKRYLFFSAILVFSMFFWALPALAEMIADTCWVRICNGPGNSDDLASAIVVDGSGNVYVTGWSVGSGTYDDYATIKYYPNGNAAWVRRYNGPGNSGDDAYAIAVDGSGNVYVTGVSDGNGTLSPQDYATIKYDPDGDTAWVRRYDGPGNSEDYACAMAVDRLGDVYVTGWSYNDGTGNDYATIKYYPNGDTAWVRRYNGPGNSNDAAYAMAVDASGNVYVTGGSYGVETDNDYATIKYHPNGDTAWVRRYDGPGNSGDDAYAIAVDDSGNVYVTGVSDGNGPFYPQDYATIKYDPEGDTAWVRRYDGPGNFEDYAYAIAVDRSGNVYVTGYSYGNGTYDDYATIKYYPNGDAAWVRRYNGPENNYDKAYAIALDDSANVYVTGISVGTGTSDDYATIRYSTKGDAAWVKRYDGPESERDRAYAIAVDDSGYVYVTGESYSSEAGYGYATIKYVQIPYVCGDATEDGVVDVGDVVFLINYLFKSGPAPDPLQSGDVNLDTVVDVGDIVYLINYLFKGGNPPCES